MIKLLTVFSSSLPALVVACAMAATSASPAVAQSAGNLRCNGCVNSKDVKDNGIKSRDIKNGQVRNPDLANDAVTGAKILDGTITGADLAPGVIPTASDPQRTLLVSPVGDGSDRAANGAALLDAIAFLGTVSPPPSLNNPWLITVEPGIYDVGSSTVELPSGTGMEGAGQLLTQIRGQASGLDAGVIKMNEFTELRHLAVFNGGAVPNTVGVFMNGESMRVSHVRTQATVGTTGTSIGLRLFGDCAGVLLENVRADGESASGTSVGIDADCGSSSTRLVNVQAVGTGGGPNHGMIVSVGNVQASNSRFVGPTSPILTQNGGEALLIGSGINLGGGPVSSGVTCFASYELLSFFLLSPTCGV